jgi:hypothetical protein
MTAPLPLDSAFATAEEAEAHDQWVRSKVHAAMAGEGQKIPHDEAMAKVRALIEGKRRAAPRLDP